MIKEQYERTINNLNQILELLGKSPSIDPEKLNILVEAASEEKTKLLKQYCRLQ